MWGACYLHIVFVIQQHKHTTSYIWVHAQVALESSVSIPVHHENHGMQRKSCELCNDKSGLRYADALEALVELHTHKLGFEE